MKKRLLSLLLAGLMLFSLTACGSPDDFSDAVIITNSVSDANTDTFDSSASDSSSAEDSAEAPVPDAPSEIPSEEEPEEPPLPEDGVYTTKEDVALYIHLYGHLPDNFITKKEARKLGWEKGSLEPYAPGMCIGGDYFGNFEGLLPDDREYTECDIDTLGAKSRGAKRIVFSDDGLIYYTGDHYESFELLYGEE